MNKFYLSLLLFISTSVAAFSQTPTISMTTTLSVGSQISFSIRGNSSSTPIQIDWGNGVKESFTIGDSDEAFGFSTKGSTIKIWGSGIEGFNIQSMELTTMEFYEAISLKTLFCKNNKIDTLDLIGCTDLTLVECKQNLISNLTLPSTTTLTYVDCSDNNLTLATLPIKQATWTDYIYSPQKVYKLPKSVYEVSEEIDLSSQLNINGNTTNYTWKTKGGTTLVDGTDFSTNNGKFTFLKSNTDSVYCEMANAAFPTLTLSTIKLAIVPPLAISMTTTTSIGSSFSFKISANTDNTPIMIDWGNGTLTNFTIGISASNISGTQSGSIIKIYGVNILTLYFNSVEIETLDVSKCSTLSDLCCQYCFSLTSINLSSTITRLWLVANKLTNIDVSKNTMLKDLIISQSPISSIDLSNNTKLSSLWISHTQITNVDLTNFSLLESFNCTYSKINTLDLSKNILLKDLSCKGIQIKNLDLSANTALTWITCGENQLMALDVSKNTALTNLDCSDNQLTTLDVTKNTMLTYLNCSSNQLTFNSLPIKQPTWTTYNYSPQAALILSKNKYSINEEIDLSKEFTHGETNTVYIWKTAGGITLVKDIDYTEDNGKLTFIKAQGDKVFCQMTNTSLPLLTLTTENITVFPTIPTLTFSTTNSTTSTFSFSISTTFNNSLIQLDWGNGTLNDYTISSSGSNISGLLTSSSIKVYGIGISNINLSSKNLTTLDVSEAPYLKTLNCSSNKLNALDLSKNNSLTSVSCQSNNLDFTTLPLKQPTWSTYIYSPQSKVALQKKNYTLSETIDLSSQLTVNGNTTYYIWKTKGGITLTTGTDYSISTGVTTFLKEQSDSVYCQMTNATFPGLTLTTTNVKITQFHTDVNDISLNAKLYPNPVKDLLNIECKENISKVEVYSITGMKLYEKLGENSLTMLVPTGNLPLGMLIVKVYCKSGIIEKKIIKE